MFQILTHLCFCFCALRSRSPKCAAVACVWEMCASEHFRMGSGFADLIVCPVLHTELSIKPKPVTAAVTFTCTRKSFLRFPDYWFNPINLSGWLLGRLYRPAHAFCFHIRFHYIFYGFPYLPATGMKGAWRSTALAGRLYSWNKHIKNDECRLPTPPLHTWARQRACAHLCAWEMEGNDT